MLLRRHSPGRLSTTTPRVAMHRELESDRPMRTLAWGLVGAGDIVRKRVGPALRDLATCDLAAVCRARADLAESSARAFGAKRWYATCRDLLADGDIEAVYLATPPARHAEQTVTAAEAGKHVLCEKPMAISVAECDRMIAACRAHGVRLGIAYYRHFYPVIGRIKDILASGEIGSVTLAQMNAFEWFNPAVGQPRHWLVTREAGGGPMFDFGCHRIEVLLHLFGPVRRVQGLTATVAFDREVEDTAGALFQFERGPCAGLMVTHAAAEPVDTLSLFGTRGSIHVDALTTGDMRVSAGGASRTECHPPASNIHQPSIEDFVDAVFSGREPAVPGEAGRAVAAIEERIYAQRPER